MGLAACEEQEPAGFREISGVYFDNRGTGNMIVDSTSVTFVYTNDNTMEVSVRVQVLGNPSATERPVAIRVAGGTAEEGTDYELKTAAVIPADSVGLDYVVELKRTPILKEGDKVLVLEVAANDYFATPFDYRVQSGSDTTTVVRYRIIFTDRFTVAPEAWDPQYGGVFSQQKFELMCRVAELDPADFNQAGGVSLVKWRFIALTMDSYIRKEVAKKENGEPYDTEVYDKQTGEPLTFEQSASAS